ncbi:NAD(P)/FAD-dependent oxidoreductase [bacterium]|nr:NAD(P)/FAD-dependent oxidoreductase [bacterium]
MSRFKRLYFLVMVNQYDIIVVGGGPAGLSAADAAAKTGVNVAVLERSREIGYPVHTSGGSWIDELQKLEIPSRFMHPIDEGVFLSSNARAEFFYAEPPSCILDVRGLYQYLAELASSAGAEIFVGTNVAGPMMRSNSIVGVTARRLGQTVTLKAPLVIDASGFGGVIARQIGLTRGFRRYGLGAEYDLFAPKWPSTRVAFLFGNKYAPSGYGWVFPHGNGRVRVGVGVIKPDTAAEPKKLLDGVLADSSLFGDAFSKVSHVEYHSGSIPSESYLQQTVADGCLVVGDAGGLISTLLGEGIRFAIDIGRMAGRVAGAAVHKQKFDKKFLGAFEQNWRSKYGRLFRLGSYLNQRLVRYSDRDWDEKIKLLSTLKAELLPSLLKGDLKAGDLWRLVSSSPHLIKMCLKTTI